MTRIKAPARQIGEDVLKATKSWAMGVVYSSMKALRVHERLSALELDPAHLGFA